MVYRIDIQHFLTHAVDHFTSTELSTFQYCIISAKIINGGRCQNVGKLNELYPTSEIVSAYAEYEDPKVLEKMYMEMLQPSNSSEGNYISNKIYRYIIKPLLAHEDVVLICDKVENAYIDVLCKFLSKEFKIDVIDLNKLFTEGRVGPIYIDRKEIKDKAVDVTRAALKDMNRALESSRDGREKLLNMMNKSEKKRKLKELGIRVSPGDDLDRLLMDEWVNDDNDDDESEYKEWE